MPRSSADWTRDAVLGTLYLVQGLVWGLLTFQLLPRWASAGVPLQTQALLLSIAGLPSVLKIGWGWWLDRRPTSRRAVGSVIASSLIISIVLGVIAWATPVQEHVVLLMASSFAIQLAGALQDAATDALALDRVPPEQRGGTNAIMLAGHHVGFEGIAGLGIGLLAAAWDLGSAIALLALATAVFAWAPVFLGLHEGERPPRPSFGSWRDMFDTPHRRYVAALAAVVLSADMILSATANEFLVGLLHWEADDLGLVLAPTLLVANVVGYASAVRIVDRFGHVQVAAGSAFGLAMAWGAMALVPAWWPSHAFMLGFVVVQNWITALFYAALHAMLMDATEPRVRATHFAVLMTLYNLPRVYGPPLAVVLLGGLGWQGLFAAAAALQCGLALAVRRTASTRRDVTST